MGGPLGTTTLQLVPTLAGAVMSIALIVIRITGGIALFTHGLPHRARFGGRLAATLLLGVVAYVATLMGAASLGGEELATGFPMQFLSFSLVLLVCLAGAICLYDISVWVALFCVTAGYTAQNLATGATELVASVVRALGANPSTPAFYLMNDLACLTIVFCATYLLLARRITHDGLAQMENRSMLAMMPVVSLVIIGYDVVVKALSGEGLALAYVVALRAFHGFACVATLWIEYQLLYRVRMERDQATAERLMAERERQLTLSRETIDAINVKCHDLRHQIRTLGAGGAVVDQAALDDLAREVSIYDSAVATGNDALDTILTEKGLVCERRDITLTVMADGGALGRMAPADLYALFGNALDNAIEAVAALDDPARRSITLVVRRTMGCVSIHVENFCAGERRFSADGLPETTKADRANHGFGVRSMRQIAERYGGTFSAEVDGGIFRLDVILPLG